MHSLGVSACEDDPVDVLGNAHMTNFFVNNTSTKELESALKAYTQTERNLKEPNPDLFFNRATIYEYLERYGEAIRDYNTAHQIDANLKADFKAGNIINFVVQTSNLVLSRKNSSKKLQHEMVKSIPCKIDGELKFPHLGETAPKE